MNEPICDSCIFWFPDTSRCICITVEEIVGKRYECAYWTAIKENRGMSEWISVDERLPERDKPVFVLHNFEGKITVFDGWLYAADRIQPMWKIVAGGRVIATEDFVTHWQPKTYPKPPEPESQKPGSTPGQHCHNCSEYKLTQGGWCSSRTPGYGTFGWCEYWKAKEAEIIKIGKILIDTSDVETMREIKRLIQIALGTMSC